MRRWLKVTVLGLLLLPVLAGGLLAVALGTETGAGWVLGAVRERVPGLVYTRHEGSLTGGVTLYGPGYSQDGLDLRAERLRFAVAPRLFPTVIRLRFVEASGLRVALPEAEPEAAPLPESLALPLKIELERLWIDGLVVTDADGSALFEANRISAVGEFHDQALFRQVELELPQGWVQAEGRVGLEQPFTADVDATAGFEQAIDGSSVPLLVEAIAGLEGSISAYQLTIDGSGQLDRIEFEAQGVVDLQETRFQGRAGWREFTWPVTGQPPRFESRSGSVQLSGWVDDWSVEGHAEMAAPGLADGTLSFLAEGDESQARIVVPEGQVLGGRIGGEGDIDWSRGGEFHARLDLGGVSTAPLYPDLPATLSGEVTVAGGLDPLMLDFSARELRADMEARVVIANGRAAYRPGEWVFERLTLQTAGSRVELDGSLDRTEGIVFLADIADLDEFLDGAEGRVSGSGRYAVSGEQTKLELDLEAENLAWQDIRAARARIVAAPPLEAGQWVVLDAELVDLSAGETQLEQLTLKAALGRQEQVVEMELRNGSYRLAAKLPGAVHNIDETWNDWSWRGQLAALRLEGPEEVVLLELQQPAALELSLEQAALRSACLSVADRARSCGEGSWSAESGISARASLDSVPLGLLGLVATNLELTQSVDGEAEFRMTPGQGPEVDAHFELTPGEIRLANDPRPLLETGEGQVSLRIVDGSIRSGTFGLPITGQGRIDLDYRVDDLEAGLDAPISGRLVADFEDLDALAIFLPIADEVRGRLDADLLLSGTLARPQLRGRLDLADGFIRHAVSGLVLSDIQVSGLVDGSGLISLSGQYRAVEGLGHLEGLADVSDLLAPSVQLDLTGNGLKLFDTRDLQLVVDPDIRLAWHEGALYIDGQLTIPRALIAPSFLPATPVLESPDVQVVAGQLPDTEAAQNRRQSVKVFGSLDVVLGAEVDIDLEVTEADLSGQARFEWSGPVLPLADGGFDISGLILAYGQRLEITQGRIGFPSVPADNPHLNIRAEREIYGNSEVRRAGLWVTGTLRRLQIEPYTDPMTTRERAQTLLVTGSDFNMERGSGAVSVGTYIAPRVFVSYGVGVFDDSKVISVRYDLGRGWGVMATSGESQTGVDISYTIER